MSLGRNLRSEESEKTEMMIADEVESPRKAIAYLPDIYGFYYQFPYFCNRKIYIIALDYEG